MEYFVEIVEIRCITLDWLFEECIWMQLLDLLNGGAIWISHEPHDFFFTILIGHFLELADSLCVVTFVFLDKTLLSINWNRDLIR